MFIHTVELFTNSVRKTNEIVRLKSYRLLVDEQPLHGLSAAFIQDHATLKAGAKCIC